MEVTLIISLLVSYGAILSNLGAFLVISLLWVPPFEWRFFLAF